MIPIAPSGSAISASDTPELGYVSLAELAAVRGRLGLPVERDLHFAADRPLSAYAADAGRHGRIVI